MTSGLGSQSEWEGGRESREAEREGGGQRGGRALEAAGVPPSGCDCGGAGKATDECGQTTFASAPRSVEASLRKQWQQLGDSNAAEGSPTLHQVLVACSGSWV